MLLVEIEFEGPFLNKSIHKPTEILLSAVWRNLVIKGVKIT